MCLLTKFNQNQRKNKKLESIRDGIPKAAAHPSCVVTSGLLTSLPVTLYSPLGVALYLCQVWWHSDNSPGLEGPIPVLWRHFRFIDITSGTFISSPRCHSMSVPSLVAIGQFLWPGQLTENPYDVTSGSVTSFLIPLCYFWDAHLPFCQVSWESHNSPGLES